MESYSSQVKILFRFSNAKGVLQYYQEFKKWHLLMTTLWKETNAWWNKHYEAFWNALEFVRKSLVYEAPFNKHISDYLLENNRYKQFKLTVKVSDEKSIEDLIEFISLVKQKSMLKFKKIECTNSKLEVKSYNMLCDYFIEKECLDIHKLKFQNSDFMESELSKLLDIKFINFVDESINLKLFQSCHIFRIERSDRELIDIINGISIPIHTLWFSNKSVPTSKDKMDLNPAKALQESVKRLTLTDVEINKIWKLKAILPIFWDKFNKLESIMLWSSLAKVEFLSSVVEYMSKKIFERLGIDQIEVGKKNEDSCTIIKHFPRIQKISLFPLL